jgi:hypothetical protein
VAVARVAVDHDPHLDSSATRAEEDAGRRLVVEEERRDEDPRIREPFGAPRTALFTVWMMRYLASRLPLGLLKTAPDGGS